MIIRADRRAMTGAAIRATLVPAAALAVHQLRYLLAFGDGAGVALARQGHAYLHSLVPWAVALLAVAAGAFLNAIGRAMAGQRSAQRFTLSLAALWLLSTAALVAIYAAQETLEGLWIAGHPAGLAGILGYGGWWALPVAACIGLVLATVFHGARWVLDAVAELRARTPARVAGRPPANRRAGALLPPRSLPLANGSSERGPPR